MLPELSGEVLRIVEAQLLGGLSDGGPADQERLGTVLRCGKRKFFRFNALKEISLS